MSATDEVAVRVSGLGKRYALRHESNGSAGYQRFSETLMRSLSAPARRLRGWVGGGVRPAAASTEDFWALRDIDFEIQRGQIFGIVGRNGAGKSTLLKILSRITEPSCGRVELNGRIASLLEVGTGFHPELSGRENIFLNGAILGMSRREIQRKFDEIVAFAEVERFLDTPVKHYSSGMYVRLAFAVAAHLEPEILVVDEVLAVGDMAFQQKCLGKMEQVSRGGRTVLFVSHHLPSVQRLCTHGLFLQGGRVALVGTADQVVERYLAGTPSDGDGRRVLQLGAHEARISSWRLLDQPTPHSGLSRMQARILLTIDSTRQIDDAQLSFVLRSLSGDLLVTATSRDGGCDFLRIAPGRSSFELRVRLPLKMGRYQLDFALQSGPHADLLDQWIAEPLLTILDQDETHLPDHWRGLVNEPVAFRWIDTEPLQATAPARETSA
jgi:lipopolysaccharide transport system ATP-binding protein